MSARLRFVAVETLGVFSSARVTSGLDPSYPRCPRLAVWNKGNWCDHRDRVQLIAAADGDRVAGTAAGALLYGGGWS